MTLVRLIFEDSNDRCCGSGDADGAGDSLGTGIGSGNASGNADGAGDSLGTGIGSGNASGNATDLIAQRAYGRSWGLGAAAGAGSDNGTGKGDGKSKEKVRHYAKKVERHERSKYKPEVPATLWPFTNGPSKPL